MDAPVHLLLEKTNLEDIHKRISNDTTLQMT